MADFFNTNEFQYLINIGFAVLSGFIIGYERKTRLKEAGIRTHILVSVGACLMTLISKYGFVGADTARIAAQIVTGIGFLGAGMIFYRRETLYGLTTAAGVWCMAGIGMCYGAGLIALGLGSTAIILLVQIILHTPLRLWTNKAHRLLIVEFRNVDGAVDKVKELFDVTRFMRIKTMRDKDTGEFRSTALVRVNTPCTVALMDNIIKNNDFIISIERPEEES